MVNRRTFIGALAAVGSMLGAARALAAPSARKIVRRLGDRVIFRGDKPYETLRQAAIWNARKPDRFPEAIVMAQSKQDVMDAVKLAKARGWTVGVRSGGHSWYAAHTRDKSILINLSHMQKIEVDAAARMARVSPATEGQVLNIELQDKHGLMFPSGHCVGVGLGGFIMCGGHGWNSRVWGPGCAQLKAVDVVNAEGELIHATETQNSDYLWAARGAGPGYFGAVVEFHVAVHPNPTHVKSSRYVFPIAALEEVVTWLRDGTNGFPKLLEVVMVGSLDDSGVPTLAVNATAFGNSDAESDAALDIIAKAPAVARATSKTERNPSLVPRRTEGPRETNPSGYRYAIDSAWTSAPSSALAPLMRDIFTTLPTPRSYIFFQCWGPVQDLKNVAYSVQGDIYISPVAVYQDPADDTRCEAWATAAARSLEPIALGGQMNDENMGGRRQRYLSDEAYARLEKMRAKYDPEGRFVSFLAPPV